MALVMKRNALCWLRFLKQCKLVATEVGFYNSDVLGINKKSIIEIEIKNSRSDFLNDFKKRKHRTYANPNKGDWVPHFFYFYVPSGLVEFATDQLKTYHAPELQIAKYGIISDTNSVYRADSNFSTWQSISVCKKPTRLHKNDISERVKNDTIARMSSDLANMYINNGTLLEHIDTLRQSTYDQIKGLEDRLNSLPVPEPEEEE